MKLFSTLLRGAALQASLISAQFATYSPSDDTAISYAVNVPYTSAKSTSGDIFIQIKGPTTRSWIAIGQAQNANSQMTNSNIFIIYPDSDGNNVTLSPRAGQGFFEPDYNSGIQAELLSGSGISNGVMTANIKCSNCNSWANGQASMSFTDSSSNWIWSSAAYGAINSNDQSYGLSQHNQRGTFTFDLTKAAGGSTANPFVTSSGSTTNSTTPATGSESGSSSSSSSSSSGAYAMIPTISTTHAAIMSLSFLLFYPLGAVVMRIGIGPSTKLVHILLQGFSYLLAIVGMGLGIWMAMTLDYLQSNHAIIGLVTVCVLVVQAPLGAVHHANYKKHGGRTAVSFVHIWLGRALMTLGAINGGLGLQLAGNVNPSGTIAYGVLAGIIYVGYFALVLGTFGKGKKRATQQSNEKMHLNHNGTATSHSS